jgi:hypothetical protein
MDMTKAHGILLALVVAAGMQDAGRSTPSAKEISERYGFLQRPMLSVDELATDQAKLPYDRIELTESNCWGYHFEVGIGRDGSIVERSESLTGTSSGPRTGTVSVRDYGHLCWLIERIGFESMSNYAWNGFDATTCTVRVWRTGSRTPITVVDYGGVGPPDLWTLRAALCGVASRASWK